MYRVVRGRSQGGVQNRVDVAAEGRGIHNGQCTSPFNELRGAHATPRERPELRDGVAGTNHRDGLSGSDTVEYIPSMISEISHIHCAHAQIVSRVIPARANLIWVGGAA